MMDPPGLIPVGNTMDPQNKATACVCQEEHGVQCGEGGKYGIGQPTLRH